MGAAANVLQGKDASFQIFLTDEQGRPVDITNWTVVRLRLPTDSGFIEKTAPLIASANARQTVAFAGGPPTSGGFKLAFNNKTTLVITSVAIATDVQAAFRAATGLTGVTVTGDFSGFVFNFVGADAARVQPAITVSQNTLVNGSTPMAATVTYNVAGVPQTGVDVVNASQGALNVLLSEVDTEALTVGQAQDMDLLVRIAAKDLNIPLIKGLLNVTENQFA